ncbi:MAG: excinuclease ABC subunit UvrC [Nannocystaceae bacterium]
MPRKVRRTAKSSAPPPGVPPDWTPRATSPEELQALVERLPDAPGVYLMRDRKGELVYVGKAHRLRARVRQYFSGHDTRTFVPLLGDLLGDIETVVTANDKEALLLENTLIKEHRPRFNVKLRDDKQYLVLRLDPHARWPRLELVRRVKNDDAHYFGPYHSANSVRHALRVVNRHFKLRTCSDFVLDHRKRPCLQYQIGRCPAPCVYEVDAAAYARQVGDVALFLKGRQKELVAVLRARMEAAAAELDFEVAARLRDQIESIETSLESQRVVSDDGRDQDVIGLHREGGQVEFVVLHVRQGKLLGSRGHSQRGMELPDAEVLHSFLAAYYDDAPMIPDEILLPAALADDDSAPLVAWLREQSGRKVTLHVPERGDRRRLVELAQRNAASNFVSRRNRQEDAEEALVQLQGRFGLSRLPRVIECYDISHIQGSDTVASMVVFVDGAPAKERYRSFTIKGMSEGLAQGHRQNDDFASMEEALGRRLRRGLEAAGDDESPWALPDLMVIDGGKGQLGRVLVAMQDLGIEVGAGGVDVVALAKERRLELGHGKKALSRVRGRAPALRSGLAEVGVLTARDGDGVGYLAGAAARSGVEAGGEVGSKMSEGTGTSPAVEAGGEVGSKMSEGTGALPAVEAGVAVGSKMSEGTGASPEVEAGGEVGSKMSEGTGASPTVEAGVAVGSKMSEGTGAHSEVEAGVAVGSKMPEGTGPSPAVEAGVDVDVEAKISEETGPTSTADEAEAAARPGQALQEWVLSTADEADEAGGDAEGKPERVFVPGRKESIRLRPGSSELFLMTRIRDEAHRFAITHHRQRRGKRALVSSLDGIEGVGPAVKKALLAHFGSFAAIRAADVAALLAVKGVGPRLAEKIHEALGGG